MSPAITTVYKTVSLQAVCYSNKDAAARLLHATGCDVNLREFKGGDTVRRSPPPSNRC